MQSLTLPKSPTPFARNHEIRDALGKALYDAMREDGAIHLFGEGCEVKMHYDAPAIERDFAGRMHTTPISEDGNVNFAVGASLLGVKPVVDVIAGDFLYRCFDSIANTSAKLDFVTGREHTIVIRAEFLMAGPTTGQRPEALFAHIPGIRIALPSTPHDAYGLMRSALASPGVSIIFEDREIQDGEFEEEDLRLGEQVPFGESSIRNYGERGGPLVLTYGVMRQVVERALEGFSRPRVIDLRSLYPIDWKRLEWCMNRHNQVLIVEPDISYGGIGAEIVAQLAERFPATLFKRLGAPKATIPASPALHKGMIPTEEDIVAAVSNLHW